MGDVKLAGVLGLYLGRAVAPAILIALVAGVVVGAAIIARKGATEGRKTAVPVRALPRARRHGRLLRGQRARRRVPRHLLRSRRHGPIGPVDACRTHPAARLRSAAGAADERGRAPAPQPPSASSSPHGQAHQDPRRARHRRRPASLPRRSRVNGRVRVERAAFAPLEPGIIRDGEVADVDGLADALRDAVPREQGPRQARPRRHRQPEDRRARRRPARLEDAKELEAAVRFQAQDQLPMPLEHAVLDYQPLDIVDDGRRPAPARAARRGAPRDGRARPRRRCAPPA